MIMEADFYEQFVLGPLPRPQWPDARRKSTINENPAMNPAKMAGLTLLEKSDPLPGHLTGQNIRVRSGIWFLAVYRAIMA